MTTAIDNLMASLDEMAATDQQAYQRMVERLRIGIDAHK